MCESFEYVDFQRFFIEINSLRNGMMLCSSISSEGAAKNIIDESQSIFFSKNEIVDDYFDEQLDLKDLEDRMSFLKALEFSKLDLDNLSEVVDDFKEKNNKFMNISLDIKKEASRDIIYNVRDASNPRKNIFEMCSVELGAVIEFPNMPLTIKREFSLEPQKNIMQQIQDTLGSIKNDYNPYLRRDLFSPNKKKYDIILPAGKGGILIHETLGHALEADLFYSENSLLRGKMLKKITDSNISIIDDHIPFNTDLLWSDDGEAIQKVNLVKNGVIEGLLTDVSTSKKYGIFNTGNGRKESFMHPVVPRMRNTYLCNGSCKKEDIIKQTKCGIYALDIGGGQMNYSTGDFVFNVFSGYYVQNGKIEAVTKPFLFKSNILEVLNQIDMVADDLSFQFGYCIKMGQCLPVFYGQPTIRIAGQILGG